MRLLGSRRALLGSASKTVVSLNFVAQSYSLNGKQYPLGVLPGWSYARTGATYAQDASGNLQYFLPNQPPITSNGLDVWQSGTNLVTQSSGSGSFWTVAHNGAGTNPVVTANYSTAPDGSQTATRIQYALNGGTTSGDQSSYSNNSGITISNSTVYTSSVWIKANSGGPFTMKLVDVNNSSHNITVTSSWTLVSTTTTSTSTSGYFQLYIRGNQSPTEPDSADISIWGAQVETGSFPTSPMLTGRNLLQYSTDFTNGAWSADTTTITGNNTLSPDGTVNAARFVGSTGSSRVRQALGSGSFALATYTASGWLRADSSLVARLGFASTGVREFTPQNYNLTTSWQYVTITATGLVTDTGHPQLSIYASDGTSGKTIYAYGFQLELGSVANSLDPTTTASLPRGAAIPSVLNVFPGGDFTLLGKAAGQGTSVNVLPLAELDDGTLANRIYVAQNGANTYFFNAVVANVAGAGASVSVPATGSIKGGVRRAGTTISGAAAGTLSSTAATSSPSGTLTLYVGTRVDGARTYNNAVQSVTLLSRAVSDGQFVTLTQ